MKLLPFLLVLAMSALNAGCATSQCGGFRQINPSRSDVLSAGTKDQILSNNEFGARQCGWRPK